MYPRGTFQVVPKIGQNWNKSVYILSIPEKYPKYWVPFRYIPGTQKFEHHHKPEKYLEWAGTSWVLSHTGLFHDRHLRTSRSEHLMQPRKQMSSDFQIKPISNLVAINWVSSTVCHDIEVSSGNLNISCATFTQLRIPLFLPF